MKILFLGTRGNIKVETKRHERHTVTIIEHENTRVAIDCGLDWLQLIDIIKVDAFVITHGHDDHIGGLQNGSPCPVYATKNSWKLLDFYPIKEGFIIEYEKPFFIGSLLFEAFFVQHSLRAPAVGYRITAGGITIFCVHDLIKIKHVKKALKNVVLYIGDGASFNHPIIRYDDGKPFGHTTIQDQIDWCQKNHVSRAIFTHCGSQIVKDTLGVVEKMVEQYGVERDVESMIAYDGMVIDL